MRYRKLDADGDFSFGHGQRDFYRDVPEAPAQAVVTRLGLWEGEWFLDTNEGTHWKTEVLGKNTAPTRDIVVITRTADTQGVNRVLAYNSDLGRDTRGFVAAITIDTIYGETTVRAPL